MFDNLGIVLVQAIGFLIVFAFFVYQIVLMDKEPVDLKTKKPKIKSVESKNQNQKTARNGLLNRKIKPIKEESKQKKLFFGRNFDLKKKEDKVKKKGLFK